MLEQIYEYHSMNVSTSIKRVPMTPLHETKLQDPSFEAFISTTSPLALYSNTQTHMQAPTTYFQLLQSLKQGKMNVLEVLNNILIFGFILRELWNREDGKLEEIKFFSSLKMVLHHVFFFHFVWVSSPSLFTLTRSSLPLHLLFQKHKTKWENARVISLVLIPSAEGYKNIKWIWALGFV